MLCSSKKVVLNSRLQPCSSVEVCKSLPLFSFGCSFAANLKKTYKKSV